MPSLGVKRTRRFPVISAAVAASMIIVAPQRATLADVYFDTTGPTEHFSDSWADIASVEVTNDATNITFKINLNPLMNDGVTPNDIQTNNFTKYDIGIDSVAGGSTALQVPYTQVFGLSSGMDYWVRSWANQGVNTGGYQAFGWNGSAFDTAAPVATSSTVPIDPTAMTLTFPLAALGLTDGSTFHFDVWSTFDNPAGQGAYDALARSSITPGAPFADPNTPGSPTPYDGTTGDRYAQTVYTVSIPVSASTWNVDADGSWSNPGNWQGGVPNGVGASAAFGAAATAPRTITVDGAFTIGSLSFNNSNAYTLSGPGTLTLDVSSGNASVTATNGSHTISAPLALNDSTTFNVAQAGSTLTVSNVQQTTSSVIKTGPGTLAVNNVRAAGLNVSAGTVSVLANGTSAAASRVGTLSISGASVDLRDNDLVLTNSSYAATVVLIASARNNGAWNGNGLTSSVAATANPRNKTLGVTTGAQYLSAGNTTFDGFTVAPTDTLVKFTYYGDTDLNGIVNFDDYARIDAGFSTGGNEWFEGDFDYNNLVNFDDYSLIDLAFNSQGGTLIRAMDYLEGEDRNYATMNTPELQMVVDHFAQFGNAYASGFLNAVPEPASATVFAGIMTVAAAATSRGRQRRR